MGDEQTRADNGDKDGKSYRSRDVSSSPPRKRKREVDDGKRSPKQHSSKAQPPSRSALNRAGGVYVPPAKLRMLQAQISDKSSEEYQRIAWEALKKSIMGLTNKVNIGNLPMVVKDLIGENLIRGKGLFVRSLLQAQEFSQSFTHVYAALVAVINTKFPEIGELVLKRLVIKFRNSYLRNQKQSCLAASRFIAHLTNQNVVDVVLSLQIILKFLNDQTDDSIELAIGLLKECGQKLTEVSSRSMHDVFDTLREILQNGVVTKRTQFAIEVLLAIRRGGFANFPAVQSELDLVDEADQVTHDIELDSKIDGEYEIDVFRFDPEYEQNERKYQAIKAEILGENDNGAEDNDAGDEDEDDADDESDEDDEAADETEKPTVVGGVPPSGPDQLRPETSATTSKIDKSEAKLISLRRTIYLTIQSSLDYEECAHKVVKLKLPDDEIEEVCHMVLDCCAQQRTYEKFYGLLGQRFCLIKTAYAEHFQNIFKLTYDTIHRLETNKLRNVAKFFAHLLHTDSVSWLILSCIKLNEDDTTSAGRIFIKHLMQELAEFMGIPKLDERTKDPTLQLAFDGLFPRDHPRNTRFAINFFTVIGLGALTDELREWLKTAPKQEPQLPVEIQQIRDKQELLLKPNSIASSPSNSSSSSSSTSSENDSSSSSDTESSSASPTERSPAPIKKSQSKVKTERTDRRSPLRDSRTRRDDRDRRVDRRSPAAHARGGRRHEDRNNDGDAGASKTRSGRDENLMKGDRYRDGADRHNSYREKPASRYADVDHGEADEIDEFGRYKSNRANESSREQRRDGDRVRSGRDERQYRRSRSLSGGRDDRRRENAGYSRR